MGAGRQSHWMTGLCITILVVMAAPPCGCTCSGESFGIPPLPSAVRLPAGGDNRPSDSLDVAAPWTFRRHNVHAEPPKSPVGPTEAGRRISPDRCRTAIDTGDFLERLPGPGSGKTAPVRAFLGTPRAWRSADPVAQSAVRRGNGPSYGVSVRSRRRTRSRRSSMFEADAAPIHYQVI
jgi:hypothetical protein